nr:uncharacterized protein LOC104085085 [Nicotiana tomentosiformis]
MEIYAKSYDVKVWRVIKKENYPLPAAAQPLVDPEDIDEYIDEQMVAVQVNAKARNLLYSAISGEEYEKISSCDTTKEMWDKLEVTYEGTNKVKETRINMLVHDYELFQMKEGESIEEMFARFRKIISDLKAFDKPYSSDDQIRKILRSLPTTWQTKIVALESQDLNIISYDKLGGDLIAFEKTHLKKTSREEKKKTVAFKSTTEGPENNIDDDPEALEEEIAIVSRNIDGLMIRCLIRPILKKTPYELWKGKKPNIGYFHPFGSKCFIQNNGKDNIGKFDPRSDEGIFIGYSINSRSFRVYNKRTLAVEDSVHVIFDENNSVAEKEITAGDEDTSQEVSQTNKPQKSIDIPAILKESTNEPVIIPAEPQKESTTSTVGTQPNELRSEPEYPKKFIIGDPREGIKTRGSLKKKANIALISQVEPKKVDEVLKDSRWI